MALPQMTEYQAAIQHPEAVFRDPELQAGKPETGLFGLPRVWSGGFALTYHLCGARDWAVRCFHREVPERQQHYTELADFLRSAPPSLFLATDYLPEGIRVGGSWYPIVKMEWLDGEPLNSFIEAHLYDATRLRSLADAFRALMASLRQTGAAHGDLQHGNILVANGSLRLIDYDGMYLPGTRLVSIGEIGHANYQHPQRRQQPHGGYGPTMDHFAAIVIYVGLVAVAERPDLWSRFSNGENILFRQEDFLNPAASPLFAELRSLGSVASLAEGLNRLCLADIRQVPSLDDFLRGAIPRQIRQPMPRPAIEGPVRQYPVLAATDREALLAQVGNMVEVVGQIVAMRRGRTRHDTEYVLLNFGDYRQGCFTLTIWSRALQRFEQGGSTPESLVHQWVSVIGLVTRYDGNWGPVPQIDIDMPSRIVVLRDAHEARTRLTPVSAIPVTAPISPRSSSGRPTATPSAPTLAPFTPSSPPGSSPPVPPGQTPRIQQPTGGTTPPPAPPRPQAAPPAVSGAPGGSPMLEHLMDTLWKDVPRVVESPPAPPRLRGGAVGGAGVSPSPSTLPPMTPQRGPSPALPAPPVPAPPRSVGGRAGRSARQGAAQAPYPGPSSHGSVPSPQPVRQPSAGPVLGVLLLAGMVWGLAAALGWPAFFTLAAFVAVLLILGAAASPRRWR